MEMELDHYKKGNRAVSSQQNVKKLMKSNVGKKCKMMSDFKKMENERMKHKFFYLVRNLRCTAAPKLKPLRLPRAQLQVIFRKRATNYRALLRKMTCKDKASYGSSPPCRQRET